MKLFLSSLAVSAAQASAFVGLVNRPAEDITLALIENAADDEPGEKPWQIANREALRAVGITIHYVNLQDYVSQPDKQRLLQVLGAHDVIWLGGGNTYYLRWLLRQTEADAAIVELVKAGKVYGGGSAGAIVAGPTIRYFESADNPTAAPQLILDGLHLTDTVVVPHYGEGDDAPLMQTIAKKLEAAGYQVACLTNEQALVINQDARKVVPA